MKTLDLCFSFFSFLTILATNAQEIKTELFSVQLSEPNRPGKLILHQVSGAINIAAYDGLEVMVKVSSDGEKVHPIEGQQKNRLDDERQEGLKQIEPSPIDIVAEEENNVVEIINKRFNTITNFEISVPADFSLNLSTVNAGDIIVKGVNGEFEISNMHGKVYLRDIGGSALIDTTDDNIEIVFEDISNEANMAFSSLYGTIDVTFPKSLKADIKAKTEMGKILTDFNIDLDQQTSIGPTNGTPNNQQVGIAKWINGKINGGGPEMHFKSFGGDIVIKSK